MERATRRRPSSLISLSAACMRQARRVAATRRAQPMPSIATTMYPMGRQLLTLSFGICWRVRAHAQHNAPLPPALSPALSTALSTHHTQCTAAAVMNGFAPRRIGLCSLSLSTTGALHCARADPELCVRQVRTRSVSAKSHPLALRCRVLMVTTPLGASQLAWGCGRRTLIASAMRMVRARAQSCRACGLALGGTACSGKTQHPRPWRASDISRCMAMKPCVGQKPRPLKHRLHSIACIPSLAASLDAACCFTPPLFC